MNAMGAEGLVGTDEERTAGRLIEKACAILPGVAEGVPANFAVRFFARTAPEDLVRYTPRELALLAAQAFDFLHKRKPGAPKVRIKSPPVTAGEVLKRISILEIVNDDMPFLVDSVMGELAERGLEVRLVAHPVLDVERDSAGELIDVRAEMSTPTAGLRESFIHLHIDRIDDELRRDEVIAALKAVLAEVRLAVNDWRPMLERVGQVVSQMKTNPPPLPKEEVAEAIEFLQWLTRNNFVFLGVREHVYSDTSSVLGAIAGSSLGILRGRSDEAFTQNGGEITITAEARAFLKEPNALVITKSTARARVHRHAAMDHIGVKRIDKDGNLVGLFRIVGLFTSTAYTHSTQSIPYLRRKAQAILARAGFSPESHSGRALVNVLETYPRDELFQIDEDTLYQFALAVLQLHERPRVRVLPRRDRFDRFVSILVFVPRDRFDSGARIAIGNMLAKVYRGRLATFSPFFPEGPMVRLHFVVERPDDRTRDPDRVQLERAVQDIVRTWRDGLADVLAEAYEERNARRLFDRYGNAFSAAYREAYGPETAIADIRTIEALSSVRPLSVDFHRRHMAQEGTAGLKVWSYDRPIPLSERVPVLEHMGFRVVDERTYHVVPSGDATHGLWLHDMMIERLGGGAIDLDAVKTRLEACFLVVMRGLAENDGYNALVAAVGLGWRDVGLIRAFSRYLRQIRVAYSQDYMWATLVKHAGIAKQIVDLFYTRFDVNFANSLEQRRSAETTLTADIEKALQQVASLDEDRIIRRFVNLVQSTVRTNFYQLDADGRPKAEIAFKLDSAKVIGMPLPRPLYEIFIYSPRVEAVHLRLGKVARGGIRWSNRPQDFRTEVLGLVKAQQVKNAVIVPNGAKGGFVPKKMILANPDAMQEEGVACYEIFMSRLLDITDNLDGGKVVPPENVIRYDGDDPYLVVAADKGTATFSDIANGIAQAHGFWLDDAFASGGSAGYDHKKMGITARGAWESVKRHFREMDIDIGKSRFSVVGVGDMSGDVFGNGMLLERTIRLVAAFDHRDIFIDPDPDPEVSFVERQRLFDLPQSSWQDYNKALISAGGGVFPRSAKEIKLSPQAQAVLNLARPAATPQEVMNAILRAPVDLLWFGGIGTYVRASTETDDTVGDRANDAIRVTGAELRCKVVGEGANLGVTQRGRIEAAFRGVRLNTDAIDNSAGVNTSDVEVNIKIALSAPMRDGRLSRADRDKLMGEITDEVARLVLRNNYQQTLALSLAQRRGLEDLGFQQRMMQTLEARAILNRTVEYLPDDLEIGERRRRLQPLTRPELAVLLAYAKLALNTDLLSSSVPDDPYLGRELNRYFPPSIGERFPDALASHRLRREIIATQLANSMINRGGPTLVVRIGDQTGASVDRIAAAFAAVRDSYDLTALNAEIEALDNKIASEVQLALFTAVQDLVFDRMVWFLRNVELEHGLASIVEHYREAIAAIAAVLEQVLPQEARAARSARVEELLRSGVPEPVARRIADLPALSAAPPIALVADRINRPVAEVAATYFAAGAFFQLDRISSAARAIVITDYFDRLALDRALDTIGDAERRLAADMMKNGAAGQAAVDSWIKPRSHEVERVRLAVHEIANSGLTLSKLSVTASMLGDLVRG
jgi:glutamate dehydrogenase